MAGASVVMLVWSGVGCTAGPEARPPPTGPSSIGPSPESSCPARAGDCLAWDDFEREDGPVTVTPSGATWELHGLACDDCGPTFTIRDGRAAMAPTSEHNSVWLATVDTGRSTDLVVSSRIRLSPTRHRANIGSVGLFVDRRNHMVCKIEVTDGNPRGLLALGDELDGVQTSLLAYRKDIGLRNGSTYRLRLTIPARLDRRPVRCEVSGNGIERTAVAHRLSPEQIDAYGAGGSQGIRIKIFEDEDDGGSQWEDFLVEPS